MTWHPVDEEPPQDGQYLCFMPSRSLDRYSVQFWHHRDRWTNDYGISHWTELPPEPGITMKHSGIRA